MSNKVEATFHGPSDQALALTIEAAEIRGYACGHSDARYHRRPTTEDWSAARRWAASYGYRTQTAFCCWMAKHTHGEDHVRMCENYQTTGEHTKSKLEDPQYGMVTADEAASGMAWATSQLAQHTGSSVPGAPVDMPQPNLMKAARPGPPRPPARRGWAPTKREIQITVALFLVLVAVSVWLFRVLG